LRVLAATVVLHRFEECFVTVGSFLPVNEECFWQLIRMCKVSCAGGGGVTRIFCVQSIVKTIPGMKPLVNASGEEVQCIPEMVIESVNQTDVDLHKELLSGVILTGDESLNPCFLLDCFAGYFTQC
jgi:hypothetical protein